MASLSIALDQFVISVPERSRSTCNVFIARVDDQDRDRLGRLFVLSEIAPAHPQNQDIIHLIQETVSRAYYGTTDRGVESAFEQALAETNSRLQDILRGEHHNWLPGFATFVGVLKDNVFVYTHVGSIQGFLMRGTRIIDLLHGGGVEAVVNPLKIFSSIVSGPVEANDHVVIATNSLLDYFSQEKIRRTVSAAPPAEAAAYFDSLLRDNPTQAGFAALILELTPAGQPEPAAEPLANGLALPALGQNRPGMSMEKLIHREQTTQELLEPSFWRSVQLLFRSGYTRAEDTLRTRLLRKPARRRLAYRPEQSAKPRSLLITALLTLWRLIKQVLLLLIMVLVTGISALRRSIARPKSAPSSAPPMRERVAGTWRAIRRLPSRQQLVLGSVAGLALILVVSLIVFASQDAKRLTAAEREQIVTSIREKTDQANITLSYGDLTGAQKIIRDIDQLIDQLPKKKSADKKLVAGLQNALTDAREKTQRRTRPTLATQASLAGLGTAEPVRVVLTAKASYVVTSRGEIVRTTDEGAPKVIGTPLQDLAISDAVADGDGLLLLAGNKLVRFSSADVKYTTPTVTLPSEPLTMTLFQNRLYLVDRATGQVLRFPRGTGGFGEGKPWITDGTVSIEGVIGIAVDGSVYLLRSDGTLTELLQGQKQPFALDPIDPPLTAVTRLWTDAASKYLYILEPKSQRLVVFNKNGELAAQYQDQSFQDARGFAVDEKGKKAYLLTSSSLERFDLTLK